MLGRFTCTAAGAHVAKLSAGFQSSNYSCLCCFSSAGAIICLEGPIGSFSSLVCSHCRRVSRHVHKYALVGESSRRSMWCCGFYKMILIYGPKVLHASPMWHCDTVLSYHSFGSMVQIKEPHLHFYSGSSLILHRGANVASNVLQSQEHQEMPALIMCLLLSYTGTSCMTADNWVKYTTISGHFSYLSSFRFFSSTHLMQTFVSTYNKDYCYL